MGQTVLLWAFKSPLPYRNRRPTLFQPMHSGVDIVSSIQGSLLLDSGVLGSNVVREA